MIVFRQLASDLNAMQYREALASVKGYLAENPKRATDILIFLYRHKKSFTYDQLYYLFFAEALIILRQYEDAFFVLEEILEQDPREKRTYALIGRLYNTPIDKHLIMTCLTSAFAKNIYEPDILTLLPSYYLEQGDFANAILFYRQLCRDFPDVVHYHKCIIDLHAKSGENELAAEEYVNLVNLHPNLAAEAAKFCHSLVDRLPNNIRMREILVEMYSKSCYPKQALEHVKAIVVLDNTRVPYAKKICKQLLSIYPDMPDVLLEMSTFLLQMERYSESVACLRQLFENNYEHPGIKANLEAIFKAYPHQVLGLQLAIELAYRQHNYNEALAYAEALLNENIDELDAKSLEKVLMGIMIHEPSLALVARAMLCKIYIKKGDWVRVESEAIRLLDTQRDEPATVALADAYLNANRFVELRRHSYAALKKYPKNGQLRRCLWAGTFAYTGVSLGTISSEMVALQVKKGLFLAVSGELASAILILKAVDRSHVDFDYAQVLIFFIYIFQGQFERAITQGTMQLSQMTSEHPLYLQSRYLLLRSYSEIGSFSQALIQGEAILSVDTTYQNISEFVEKGPQITGANRLFGVLPGLPLYSGSSTQTSVILIDPYLEMETDSSLDSIALVDPLLERAMGYIFKGEFDLAEACLTQAGQMDPNSFEIQINLSVLAMMLGKWAAAQAALEKANLLKFEHFAVQYNFGILAFLMGDFEDAQRRLLRVTQSSPNLELAHLVLGDAYFAQGDFSQAVESWQKAGQSGRLVVQVYYRTWYFIPMELSVASWVLQLGGKDRCV